MSRYERNHPAISEEEQVVLRSKHVFVAGCGGLGGYIIELLSRIGVGHLTVADGDTFADSNLNRQLLSDMNSLGLHKAERAKERVTSINPHILVTPVTEMITAENVKSLISGCDLVVDALDNAASRLALAKGAAECGITVVTGAISGWYGRVTVLRPEDTDIASFLWSSSSSSAKGNLGHTAACTASIQASEAVKVLLGRPGTLVRKFLEIDLLNADFTTIDLS